MLVFSFVVILVHVLYLQQISVSEVIAVLKIMKKICTAVTTDQNQICPAVAGY